MRGRVGPGGTEAEVEVEMEVEEEEDDDAAEEVTTEASCSFSSTERRLLREAHALQGMSVVCSCTSTCCSSSSMFCLGRSAATAYNSTGTGTLSKQNEILLKNSVILSGLVTLNPATFKE